MAHTCVARSMISARREFGGIINETQRHGHVAQLVHIAGAAGPNRPATLLTLTFLEDSFFSWGCHVYPHLDEVPDVERLYIAYTCMYLFIPC